MLEIHLHCFGLRLQTVPRKKIVSTPITFTASSYPPFISLRCGGESMSVFTVAAVSTQKKSGLVSPNTRWSRESLNFQSSAGNYHCNTQHRLYLMSHNLVLHIIRLAQPYNTNHRHHVLLLCQWTSFVNVPHVHFSLNLPLNWREIAFLTRV